MDVVLKFHHKGKCNALIKRDFQSGIVKVIYNISNLIANQLNDITYILIAETTARYKQK